MRHVNDDTEPIRTFSFAPSGRSDAPAGHSPAAAAPQPVSIEFFQILASLSPLTGEAGVAPGDAAGAAIVQACLAAAHIARGDLAAAGRALEGAARSLGAVTGARGEPAQAAAPLRDAPPDDALLRVGEDGRWFQLGRERAVDLARRGPLRRILARLSEARGACPGRPVSLWALFEAGWPGERAQAASAAARVYTTVARLRKLGLAAALVRQDDGYMVDPSLRVERVPLLR